jgi:ATP phosphoribosyltransferase regulatory subunit HisZ
VKRQSTKEEKGFANYSSNKGLMSKLHKEFKKLNTKRTSNPTNKWADKQNRHFSNGQKQKIHKECKST